MLSVRLYKKQRSAGLIQPGPCNIHTVDSAFGRAIAEYRDSLQEFDMELYSFFKQCPRTKALRDVQFEHDINEHTVKRYVPEWCVSLGCVERIPQQWFTVLKYIR